MKTETKAARKKEDARIQAAFETLRSEELQEILRNEECAGYANLHHCVEWMLVNDTRSGKLQAAKVVEKFSSK